MKKCQNCADDDHDMCWDTKPDRTCPCCLDTWFEMLGESIYINPGHPDTTQKV